MVTDLTNQVGQVDTTPGYHNETDEHPGRLQGQIESLILSAAFFGRKPGQSAAELQREWLEQGPDHALWDHLMKHVGGYRPAWIQVALRANVARDEQFAAENGLVTDSHQVELPTVTTPPTPAADSPDFGFTALRNATTPTPALVSQVEAAIVEWLYRWYAADTHPNIVARLGRDELPANWDAAEAMFPTAARPVDIEEAVTRLVREYAAGGGRLVLDINSGMVTRAPEPAAQAVTTPEPTAAAPVTPMNRAIRNIEVVVAEKKLQDAGRQSIYALTPSKERGEELYWLDFEGVDFKSGRLVTAHELIRESNRVVTANPPGTPPAVTTTQSIVSLEKAAQEWLARQPNDDWYVSLYGVKSAGLIREVVATSSPRYVNPPAPPAWASASTGAAEANQEAAAVFLGNALFISPYMANMLAAIAAAYGRLLSEQDRLTAERAQLEKLGVCTGSKGYRPLASGRALLAIHGFGDVCPIHGPAENGGRLRKYIKEEGSDEAQAVLAAMARYGRWNELGRELGEVRKRLKDIEKPVETAERAAGGK